MKKSTIKKILEFRDERNWKQFHTPKNLAVSISVEAAELLENFQWTEGNNISEEKKKAIEEEIADVLIYCTFLAEDMGLDIDDIVCEKMKKNKDKYPVDKAYGNCKKYSEKEPDI